MSEEQYMNVILYYQYYLELHIRYGCAYWKEALILKRQYIKGGAY